MNVVWFQKQKVSLAALPPRLADQEQHAAQFCKMWQQGQPEFWLLTSGSTGTPKPQCLTRAQMEASARLTGEALGLTTGDKALVCLPTRYIAGTMMLVRGLVLGLELHLYPPHRNPLALVAAGTSFDFTAMVPMQLETILRETPQALAAFAHAKAILLGGAPLSATLEEQVQALPCPVYHTYGMTETVSHVALRRLNGPERSAVFTSLPGIDLRLDDRGCLCIRGAVTNAQWITTNDLVELHADGRFRWLGRADHVINSGGVKVQPEAVEQAVDKLWKENKIAERYFVGSQPDKYLGQCVVLFVEGMPFPPTREEWLLEALRERLPRYHAPKRLLYVPSFEETPTGKIDRTGTLQKLARS
ncbi:O-succinylbenzoic acid--CoA ligase [Catalinimonas alkaloidigena]|uniref:O-succinylbenzoic acid--CoA ligase n=1 Tax=Catalinimonas alkaloidigena TaxID=1075417 RepID=A0A1G9RRB8_9BACT|nr:AMP-binding protein [Catalinimonas alkaloidigena]SDM25869.1 O-succinylbenzoic acid--CoA ligase [Catalinimonas alkaloidigena]